MRLYSYFRSSAAYRVRIALNLKGLQPEIVPVHLLRDGGAHNRPDYRRRNPQGLIPALELDDGTVLAQSVAIIEYLDAIRPEPRLIPADPVLAARVRAAALVIACEIHPLNNLRVLNYLKDPLGHGQAKIDDWYRHWVAEGLRAVEATIPGGPFCFGPAPTLADVLLVPQVFNARRFKVALDDLPKIVAADAACAALETFARAHPSQQPDAEP